MLIKLKDGRYMAPVMMGSLEDGSLTKTLLGVDVLSKNKDLFGEYVTERFSLDDIEGFYGGYFFSGEQWNADEDTLQAHVRMAKRLAREDEEKRTGPFGKQG